jgi:UDP-2,3-diacylglucosamine pyrophosphatase LpxH
MTQTAFIVISDLHLADGHAVLDGFQARQQAALEGLLLASLQGKILPGSQPPTLIINGDCFDFLAVPPYLETGTTTPTPGLEKLARVAAAHGPFFTTLRAFVQQGGHVVFLPGNHDIELCFQEVRDEIARLLNVPPGQGGQVTFGLHQSYQPLPDVYIEHGNQYDEWNIAEGVWDEQGNVLTPRPERITLPLGTQYMHRAALPISVRYPYFDHFDPSLGITRQIALLSLLAPELVVSTARATVRMMSYAYEALAHLAVGEEQQPAQLFSHAMPDFARFQADVQAHAQTWLRVSQQLYTGEEREEMRSQELAVFFRLYSALQGSADAALQAIFQPVGELGNDGTTRGLHRVLRTRPALHVAIAGHTHTLRQDHFNAGDHVYVNTASWTTRYRPPTPDELTPDTLAWLRDPTDVPCPLQEHTAAIFALVSATDGHPSTAQLCAWEGGLEGQHRVLTY